jgi:hypothetical protein
MSLKIDPVYRIYSTSYKKAIKGLLKSGFIMEREVEDLSLIYVPLKEVDVIDGWPVYVPEDAPDSKPMSFFELYELHNGYHYRRFNFTNIFVPICHKNSDGKLELKGYVI